MVEPMTLVFPVAGGARYVDDFGTPRVGHTHQGNDLFAEEGRALLAVEPGVVRLADNALGGFAVSLQGDSGARYYYAHMRERTPLANGARVAAGDFVGTLGRTGNAKATPPHLHFEVHPQGGAAVDPFPLLQVAEIRHAPPRGIHETPLAQGLAFAALAVVMGGVAWYAAR
jgi:murein DD-endopeptidase MepM/ murein hydrolase activator NlpD